MPCRWARIKRGLLLCCVSFCESYIYIYIHIDVLWISDSESCDFAVARVLHNPKSFARGHLQLAPSSKSSCIGGTPWRRLWHLPQHHCIPACKVLALRWAGVEGDWKWQASHFVAFFLCITILFIIKIFYNLYKCMLRSLIFF